MIKKLTALIALLISLGVMTYAGTNLVAANQVYSEGNETYDELSLLVRGGASMRFAAAQNNSSDNGSRYSKYSNDSGGSSNGADGSGNNGNGSRNNSNGGVALGDNAAGTPSNGNAARTPEMLAALNIPDLEINFEILRNINKDAAAWLYCPDTVIDYPVMAADDYNYYLHHLPDGKTNANGSLFIDYNCASDFSGKLTVIYGHHMKSGRMFGSLEEYKKQVYFENHPYMYLYTDGDSYRIDLLYGFVIGEGQWRSRAFMYEINMQALLGYAENNTTFNSGARYQEEDKIVALSTCSYEFNDARYVVLGILR